MQVLVLASAILGFAADGGGCAVAGSRTPAGARDPAARPGPAVPSAVPSLALQLNLPAFRLDAVVDDARVASFPVAIGMRSYRTPIGRFELSSVEWNPWWIPPKSDWARKEKVTPPGGDNPMGRVKLNWATMYFLHGTPFPRTVGHPLSHGCVRMRNEDAVRLATLVLQFGALHLDSASIASMAGDTATTRAVDLDVRIPLDIRYETVEWRNDSLWVHQDVYRRGPATIQRALEVLADAGLDTALVRRARLRSVVNRGRRAHAAVAGDSLFTVPLAPLSGLP